MKIHYISHHAILEYDEVKLLTDLGHEVYANGAYRDPKGAYTLPRPGIPGAPFDQMFFDLTATHPKTDLPSQLIDPYDVIIIMHQPDVLLANWEKIKHKRVIWRTIGQSLPHIEAKIKPLKDQGLQIVRYSKMERNLVNYAGEDAMIYFYKDPLEFSNWSGHVLRPVNFTQSLKGRRDFTHHDEITQILQEYPDARVYGGGNDDLGPMNGGDVPFENLKGLLRDSRVYVYGGTWPASYTLSFIEALMTGIPVVAIGSKLAELQQFDPFHFYEIPEIIKSGVNGFVADDINQLKSSVRALIEDYDLAMQIGTAGRKTAIEVFGKEKIMAQWKEFLDNGSQPQNAPVAT